MSTPRASGTLRSLRHRNYRLFVAGQSVSLVGTWITRVATGWLVYRLTGSELLLGVVGFAGQIPVLVLSPLAGVLIDRQDRRQVLIWTQALSIVQSVAVVALTLSGLITVTHIILLQLVQGARQDGLLILLVTVRPSMCPAPVY